MNVADIPLALYVHLPWCVRKCPYCDFNSHTAPQALPELAYRRALIADLDSQLDLVQGRALVSIFFGGGTPSLLSPAFYAGLLQDIAERVGSDADCEVTLEANPGTMEHGDWATYRAAGINRVSLGMQSFDDGMLTALGRIHGSADARQAIATLRQAGFTRINLDLMHGLPGQDLAAALHDLRQALAQEPEQISWYQLTLEPNTVFYRQRPRLPEAEILEAIDAEGSALLQAAGYAQYEVSAWARGRACAHNLNYWTFGDYLAIGAGAHGKATREGQIWRYQQSRLPADYLRAMDSGRHAERQIVAAGELPFEFFMNALRLRQGVDRALFEQRTGCSTALAEHCLAPARQQGLIADDSQRWRCTDLGYRFLNRVLDQLVDNLAHADGQ